MKYITWLIILLIPAAGFGQNLTGTWEGSGGGTTFIRLVVKHRGDSLFGYTYDEGGGYCKATFLGRYSQSAKRLVGRGNEMIENSGTHVLTRYDLLYSREAGGEFLRENLGEQGFLDRIFGGESRQYLKKVSNRITSPVPKEKKEEPVAKAVNPPVIKPGPASKPVPTLPKKDVVKNAATVASTPPVVIKPTPVLKTPSPAIVKTDPLKKAEAPAKIIVKTAPPSLIKAKDERASKLVETIYTKADSVKMFVYDNGEVDGDTVTVFINNALVLDRYRISDKPKEISFPVSGNGGVHTIELFANNLGTIPPNTALIIIIAGKERFELRASYDLSTNAKIVIRHHE